MSFIVAADTGGTFTDLAVYDTQARCVRYAKSLTTYDDLVEGMMNCLAKTGTDMAQADILKLGTTLAINTFIMRTGARTALVATEGFKDVLELRRGNRSIPFDLRYRRHAPLVSRDLCFEVRERMAGDGSVLEPLDFAALPRIAAELRRLGAEAVAVSFYNAYANNLHEEQASAALRDLLPGTYVCAATEISREWYEFERTSTAVANAYVGPVMKGYVTGLGNRLHAEGFRRNFFLMASNGGVFSRARTEMQPVMLVESGPVGGCIGAGIYAQALGRERVIAFDMGGTTAKCALIENGTFEVKSPYYIGGVEYGFPIRGGVLDIVEVGSGGGSIAWLDEQKRLNVGPRSAGSTPGPVAYGRGGTEPTITDANLILGRIDADQFLGGEMTLDLAGAHKALEERIAAPLGYAGADAATQTAHGILQLGTITMANAIKRITVERGLDPRDFALLVFGGGGPLHGCTLAREMSIPEVIVPPYPGIFSALGMLLADAKVDEVRPFLKPLSEATVADLEQEFAAMEAKTGAALTEEIGSTDLLFFRQSEMRYRGQKHAMRVDLGARPTAKSVRAAFEATYLRRYGHVYESGPVEFVSLVLTVAARISGPTPELLRPAPSGAAEPRGTRQIHFGQAFGFVPTPVYERSTLPAGFQSVGPAAIEEYGSTTLVEPGWRFEVGSLGEIRIRLS